MRLIENSISNKSLPYQHITIHPYSTKQIVPDILVAWAKQKNISVPGELAEKVRATTSQRKSKNLRSDSDDTALGERERATVRKIVAGLLMQGFKATELSQPYTIAGEIEKSLQSAGIELSKDTIAKWVKDACELIANHDEKTVKKQ